MTNFFLLKLLTNMDPYKHNQFVFDELFKPMGLKTATPAATKMIDIYLIQGTDIHSIGYKLAVDVARLHFQAFPSVQSIVLSDKTGSQLIKILGESCFQSIIKKERMNPAKDALIEVFKYFKIKNTTWVKNINHFISILVVKSFLKENVPYPEDIVQAIHDVEKDTAVHTAIIKECFKIIENPPLLDAALIVPTFARGFIRKAKEQKNEHLKERELEASRMADQLLREEELEKEKLKQKKNKKKKEQKTVSDVTPKKMPTLVFDDTDEGIYQEEECVICMDHIPDYVLDCGHNIFCKKCAVKVEYKCLYCERK